MRELIEQQLKNCSYANLNNFDPVTCTFRIPKYVKPHFALGQMYLVQVSGAVVNNTDSVIASNYNNGTAPKFPYLKIFVSKTLGKMIYVDSLAFDPQTKQDINIMWSGWLPVDELTMLSTIMM
jgi:hypothetical protein